MHVNYTFLAYTVGIVHVLMTIRVGWRYVTESLPSGEFNHLLGNLITHSNHTLDCAALLS